MNLKMLLIFLISFTFSIDLAAQSGLPSADIDGKYHLMQPDRSPRGGTTKEMLVEYAERNGQKMLAFAACKQGCVPAVYTYQEEPSQKLGKLVFFNSFGLYMIAYDENSFVSVIPDAQLGKSVWKTFRFSNFYSKDASKAASMNTDKITSYAIEISEQMTNASTAPKDSK